MSSQSVGVGSWAVKATSRQQLLEKAAKFGWAADKEGKKGYIRMKCGCGDHFKWVHKTPSTSNYWTNCLSEMHRKCVSGVEK